jgi:hypothetical protein
MHPCPVDPATDRHTDGRNDEQLVVDADAGHGRQDDQGADALPTQAKQKWVERPEQRAGHRADPAPHAHPANHHERECAVSRHREHRAEGHSRDRPQGQWGREVDADGHLGRVIDLAAVEEGVDQPAAGFRLLPEDGVLVAEPRQHDLVAVGQVRQELRRRDLRWRIGSTAPPMRSVSTSEVRARL